MRWVRGASAVVLVAVLAAGCGGAGDNKDASSNERDEAAAGASQDAGGTATAGAPEGKADKKSAAVGTTTTTKAASGAEGFKQKSAAEASGLPSKEEVGEPDGSELPAEPLPLTVELSSTCVRPGSSLTVTVKSVPEAVIGYDTTWADGKSGWDAPNRGGSARGSTDAQGTWTNTAVIGADAPKGKAHMDVIGADTAGHMGKASVDYQVSDALGKCS